MITATMPPPPPMATPRGEPEAAAGPAAVVDPAGVDVLVVEGHLSWPVIASSPGQPRTVAA